ncbi:phage portal protein [Bacillaceae bacterium Marseille-Q3522]|nr:phage portal protein [Bacillaceae bacterium Marseille-Q3522]
MEIEVFKKLIKENNRQHAVFVKNVRKAKLYYKNENDILRRRRPVDESQTDPNKNPLRNADNRVSHNWHQLLLNQKAAYAMTVPPAFDVDETELNKKIVNILGDLYPKVAKDLCVNAGNAGIAWLHVWIDENNLFQYGVVETEQCIPIYAKTLDKKLVGMLRIYEDMNGQGEKMIVYEYWNDRECVATRRKKNSPLDDLEYYPMFSLVDEGTGEQEGTETFTHDWGAVPFIPFRNNGIESSDLNNVKSLIDVYDKVYSGFVNDLDDIQEIVFVVTNYGGTDKTSFLQDLSRYKMVEVTNDGEGDKSGVDTLAIEIPVEARDKVLEITKKQIFISGQGVDPDKDKLGNSSGVALKFLYSLLELKTGLMETEFRLGFAELVRFILRYLRKDDLVQIKQTWTRSSISNDLEQAQIVSTVAPFTSKENIAKSNPIVEDWQDEIRLQKQEQQEDERMEGDFKPGKDVTDHGGEEGQA